MLVGHRLHYYFFAAPPKFVATAGSQCQPGMHDTRRKRKYSFVQCTYMFRLNEGIIILGNYVLRDQYDARREGEKLCNVVRTGGAFTPHFLTLFLIKGGY